MSQRLDRLGNRLTRRAFLQKALLQTAATAGIALTGARLWWPVPLLGRAAGPGIVGTVRDLLTAQPVPGATIVVDGSTALATSDQYGRYQLALDAGSYDVHAIASGYLDVARSGQVVTADAERTVDFAMLRANPTPEEQELIYAKVVQEPEWPSPANALGPAMAANGAAPTVVVPDTIWVRLSTGSVVQMALDEYLRHVVPYEMPASWPTQALRAQAVAARTYAVAYGATSSHPICTTTSCQVYGDTTYPQSDDAVWATHNVVATYNGNVITAFYFARCNGVSTKNSEDVIDWRDCTRLNWNYVAYCRARSCSGHAPFSGYVGSTYYPSSCGYYGHGVGMCQNGAKGFAEQGLSFDQILNRFYTGIQLTLPVATPPQLGTPSDDHHQFAGPMTLRWTGASAQYQVTVVSGTGGVWTSGWLTGTSYSISLPAGSYAWYVIGQTGSTIDGQSASRHFTLVEAPYRQTLPTVTRGS